ncbi:hypothetical protein ACIA8G_02250 [Lentzea sp. NPDC051213]|uniref:hypothetical protein n=1 Tax=Lentzea sp. NPDC051213 TaxID=3364126 RepID=UPI0037BD15F4
MRTGVVALALTAAFAVVAVPNAVAEQGAPCTWAASKIAAPDGYDPAGVRVRGTDSRGNFVGVVSIPAANNSKVAVWTDGRPRVADELGELMYPSVADENSSGTVLLSAGFVAEGRSKTVLFTGAHTGRGTTTELVAPAGYRVTGGTALNERGDVLGSAEPVTGGKTVSVLWSTLAAGPIVIDSSAGLGTDLDDDGTVLLEDSSTGLASLWRNGEVTRLALPEGNRPVISGLRSGKVIGYHVTSWPGAQSFLWDGPANVLELEQGGTAAAINAGGLIAGRRDAIDGKTGVWRNTTFLGDLPLPDGLRSVTDLYLIGDDDTIFGQETGYGAIRWTCT